MCSQIQSLIDVAAISAWQWQQALYLFVSEQSGKSLPDVITCIASISARVKREQWQQAAFVTAFTGQLVKFHLKNDGHLSAFVPLSLVACAGRTMHSANDQIRSLCLCAIVPLCLAPHKTVIAKQVPARCGHLFELHVKSGRHSSAFVLLYLCAFRQRNSKDFKVSPTLRSANDAVKSLCLCAIVRLCLAPNKTVYTKEVPACCGQLVELLLKSDRHSSAFVGLCLCAFGQKKVYKQFKAGPTRQSANDQIRFQNGRFLRPGSRAGVMAAVLGQAFQGRARARSRAGLGRAAFQGRARAAAFWGRPRSGPRSGAAFRGGFQGRAWEAQVCYPSPFRGFLAAMGQKNLKRIGMTSPGNPGLSSQSISGFLAGKGPRKNPNRLG